MDPFYKGLFAGISLACSAIATAILYFGCE